MATKDLAIAPLTGVLDLRSSPDMIPQGGVRYRQNFQTTGDGKIRRGTGFSKAFSEAGYNNADYHDQLLALDSPTAIRQPITGIFSAESTAKSRALFVTTQSRIARLNEYSGNYKLIANEAGGEPTQSANSPHIKAAQVGDYLVFTNGIDAPKYHLLEQLGESGQTLYEFEDFATIGLGRARLVWAWHNVIIFADVEMDSERFAYRVLWSDYDNPTSFDPSKPDSISGYKDLYFHEEILAGAPCGNSFLIYTTHGIWEMSIVGGDATFAFRRLYNAEDNNQKATLAYPNCLVNLGDSHLFVANEDEGGIGLYVFSQFYSKPDRPEWLHRSTDIFANVDKRLCESHCAGIHGDEVIVSMAEVGATNDCPNISLRINMTYKVADVLDHGFTAFCNYNSQRAPTLRDFILQYEICDLYDLYNNASIAFNNEGLPLTPFESDAPFEPQHIFTDQQVTFGSQLMEDTDQPTSAEDSLCAMMGGQTIDSMCRSCKGETLFMAASSEDWCLKEMGDVFYREICQNPSAVGTMTIIGYQSAEGSYALDGYDSIIRYAPMFVKNAGLRARMFEIDCIAVGQVEPNQIGLRVGISAQVADPNTDECRIVWHQHSLQDLKCISTRTAANHRLNNTKPSETINWNFWRDGKILYFELKITGTGGDSEFSRANVNLERYELREY